MLEKGIWMANEDRRTKTDEDRSERSERLKDQQIQTKADRKRSRQASKTDKRPTNRQRQRMQDRGNNCSFLPFRSMPSGKKTGRARSSYSSGENSRAEGLSLE